jgi:hypothetical protein
MNKESPSNQSRTRAWWLLLIATALLGPFVPFLCEGMMTSGDQLGRMLLGALVWLILMIVVSAVTGWCLTTGRGVGSRVCLTLLFVIVACAVGLGLGFVECNVANAVWSGFST